MQHERRERDGRERDLGGERGPLRRMPRAQGWRTGSMSGELVMRDSRATDQEGTHGVSFCGVFFVCKDWWVWQGTNVLKGVEVLNGRARSEVGNCYGGQRVGGRLAAGKSERVRGQSG